MKKVVTLLVAMTVAAPADAAWRLVVERDEFDDSVSEFAVVTSSNTQPGLAGREVTADLVVSCTSEGAPQIMVVADGMFWGSQLNYVEYRVDDSETARAQAMPLRSAGGVIAIRDQAFVLEAASNGAQRLRIRATPFRELPVMFDFTMEGGRDLIAARGCTMPVPKAS